jgi:DNA damage-binding protein 1
VNRKANRVEIWTLSLEGLEMVYSQAIFGRVSMLEKVRPPGAKADHLFIGTLRSQYFTVAWNAETRSLDTVQSFADVTDKHLRDSQSRDRCVVDPTGQHMVMELFEGILNLVKVVKPRKPSGDYLDRPEQVRITELQVRATRFLYSDTKQPKLAILYNDGKANPEVRLATYRLVDEKGQYSGFNPLKDRENTFDDLDFGASHLIPVPKSEVEQKRYMVRNTVAAKAQLGGVIVVGEVKMTYLDDESGARVELALEEASIFVAWERYDDLNYLLADNYARLFLLTLNVEGAVVTGMEMRLLGDITKATALVHMANGLIYIASHEGDSQVVRVNLEPDEPGVEILQTMANIAPILDFVVMDMGGAEGGQTNEYSSGQARLITGSGAWEEGSLRSVRSGVGLEDIGILADIEHIDGLFSLRSNGSNAFDDIVVVSLPIETRIFKFDAGGEVEELEAFRGFTLDKPTLLAMNLHNDLVLQVTSASAKVVGTDGAVAEWKPPPCQVITAVSANANHLLISANGVALISLDISNGLEEIASLPLGDDSQVACVHVSRSFPKIGVVGFWKSGSISILNLSTLELIHTEDLRRPDSTSIPRNIVLTQILPEDVSGPTLLVSMEDGIVLSFIVNKKDLSLSGKKSIVLGTQQAQFQILPRSDGLFNVFAICEHPSLIYGSEGRIVYSAVTAEDATHICSFNSEAYPDSIMVSTAEHLKISHTDSEKRTHVRTLQIGETVRSVCYSQRERAFAIGCIRKDLNQGEEVVTSNFRFVEDVMFGDIGKPFQLGDENGPELIECIIRAELPIQYGDGSPGERFIVGTSYLDEDRKEDNAGGRILVFGVDSEKSPYLIMSHVLRGACRKVAILDGKIVAALVKTVVMFNYLETTETSATLEKLATYRTATCPISLDVSENIIVVGDMMKSVSLVEYIPGRGGMPDKLNEVSRHMEAIWTTSVAHIEEHSYLESDHYGNLLVLQRNVDGVTVEDRKRLDMTSEINLGEQVNKIVRFKVDTSATAMVIPKAFLATVSANLQNPDSHTLTNPLQTEGSIYLFSTISASSQDLLMRLQERMSSAVRTLGELEFTSYRSFKSDAVEHDAPYRFVDGELVERFLDLDEAGQEEVCRGLGPSVEDVRNLVEELKRLH